MTIKVGLYELHGDFQNADEAREKFIEDYPLVVKDDLEKELKKKFPNEKNKSRDITKPTSESQSGYTKASEKVTGRKQP